MNSGRDRGSDLALLAVLVIWVSSYAFFKIGFREVYPLAFTLVRFAIMTPIAFAVLWLRERDLRLSRRDIWPLVVSSLIGHSIYQVLYVTALDWTTASTMALISSMIPVFAAVFLTVLRIERLAPVQWMGVVVALAAVALFVEAGAAGTAKFGSGALLGLGAAVCFALYGVTNKPLLARISAARLMAWGILIGLIPIIPVAMPYVIRQNWAAVSPLAWFCIIWAALLPVYLAYLLWNWAISRQGVARTTVVSYLVPVFTAATAHFVLGDRLTAIQIVAGVIVLGGVALTRRTPEMAGQ